MPNPQMRAADTDRETMARHLGEHFSAGRLSAAEYEERVARAYAATTYGDLAELTTDLPSAATTSVPASRPQPYVAGASATGACGVGAWGGSWAAGHRRAAWGSWLTTALIVVAIWAITSIAAGGLAYFWPIWVVGPWGAVLLAQTVTRPRPRDDRRHPRV